MTWRWAMLLAMLAISGWLALSNAGRSNVEGVVEITTKARVAGARAAPSVPQSKAAAISQLPPSPAAPFVAVLAHRDRGITQDPAVGRPMLADPFAARDWSPADKPVATSRPAPAPAAPPVPFAYLGKQRIDGRWQVFLSQGEQTLIVQEGQSFDNGTYRVESVKPPSLVLQYLPLAQEQTIGIGGEE